MSLIHQEIHKKALRSYVLDGKRELNNEYYLLSSCRGRLLKSAIGDKFTTIEAPQNVSKYNSKCAYKPKRNTIITTQPSKKYSTRLPPITDEYLSSDHYKSSYNKTNEIISNKYGNALEKKSDNSKSKDEDWVSLTRYQQKLEYDRVNNA